MKFNDRYEVYTKIVMRLHEMVYKQNWRVQDIADKAGVHQTTLNNWMTGKTVAPRLDTLTKVGDTVGYEITLRRKRK